MYSKTRPVLQNISIITEGDSKRISERQKRKEKYWKEISTIKLNVKIFLKSLLKISKGHAFPLDCSSIMVNYSDVCDICKKGPAKHKEKFFLKVIMTQ